ncbi:MULTISPECIES: hypothetical protein [unclassified Corallococcus]|uniref:hypothetical protein n=1 Tax=Corallococcus TaxID=83461 RepID=UPI001CC11563|nr:MULTISPECIES: hypothetical protein [unclassified Corallococcus]MBZ4336063.1 hypothetical protein [Corallococcus sp. AS-1-12]MBZ4376690.1 hypothetical protein [Corallococcus sp. AS-1-6]
MLRTLFSGVALSFAFVVGMAVSSQFAPGEAVANEEAVLVSTGPSSAVPDQTTDESSRLLGCCTGDGQFCINTAACQARGAGTCGAPCN